jgi:tetratricopeptide (TPR) repeat protein
MVQIREAGIEVANLLKDLQLRFKPLLSRRAGVVLGLWGDAGMGKTHTARGLLSSLGCRGISLHCAASPQQWLQALPQASILPMWAERVLERVGRGELVSLQAAADALQALLAELAPVVVHLEDFHEASPEQAELIGLLAGKVKQTPGVGLLLTSRSQPPEPFKVQRLEPLDWTATGELLARELGAALPSEASRWIFERSRGNPLFTLEHLRYLARGGYLWSDGQRWNWRTPPPGLLPVTIEALIEGLVAEVRGSLGAAEVLEARAMLPQEVEPGIWRQVAGLSEGEFEQAWTELKRRSLLNGGQFAHPLFKEVTLHTLSSGRRQELSQRAIRALQGDAVMAAGFIGEAGLEPALARQLLAQAVQACRERHNPIQAARFLGQMVPYSEGVAQAQIALEAAQALKSVDVIEAARLARLAVGFAPYRQESLYLQAELEAIQGRLKEAERLLQPMSSQDHYWVLLLKLRGSAMDYSGVLEILRGHPQILDRPDAETAHRCARAYAQNGQLTEAEQIVGKALRASHLSQSDQALLLRASSQIALMKSDYASAESLEAQIQTLARGMGNLRLLDQALFNRALALEGLGRYRECMKQLESAMEVCLELGDRTAYIIAQVAYARHLFECADYERAEGLLIEARDHLSRLDPSVYLVDCQNALGILYLEWQTSHGVLLALKHARASFETAQQIKNPRNIVSALHTLTLTEAGHNPQQALVYAEQTWQAAEGLEVEETRFLALQARAVALEALGQDAEALELYRGAQQLSRASGSLLEYHKLGLKIAQLSHDSQQALEHLDWLEERGLRHGVKLAQRWLGGVWQGGRGSWPWTARAEGQPINSLSSVPSSEAVSPSTKGDASPRFAPATRNPEPGTRTSTLQVLGPMRFAMEGSPQPVRGQKRQELLALLLEARLLGRSEVGRLELLDLMYPGAEEAQAASALKSTVHVIRSSFGQQVIQTSPQGYALGPVQTDVEMFLQEGDPSLWRGAYLEGVGYERSEAVQLQLQTRLKQSLEPLDAAEQLRLAKLLVAMDPYDLASWRILLQALRLGENYRSLGRSYQECRVRLQEVGEALPERWQVFLGVEDEAG